MCKEKSVLFYGITIVGYLMLNPLYTGDSPHGVMVKAMDCRIIVSEFEL